MLFSPLKRIKRVCRFGRSFGTFRLLTYDRDWFIIYANIVLVVPAPLGSGNEQGNRVKVPDGNRRCECRSTCSFDESQSLGNWEGRARALMCIHLKGTSQKTYKDILVYICA